MTITKPIMLKTPWKMEGWVLLPPSVTKSIWFTSGCDARRYGVFQTIDHVNPIFPLPSITAPLLNSTEFEQIRYSTTDESMKIKRENGIMLINVKHELLRCNASG